MENKYYEELQRIQNEIIKDTKTIFKIYNNELEFYLQDLNLLDDIDNVIESSTAIGYAIEEFVSVKLRNLNDHIIREGKNTTASAYDILYENNNIDLNKVFINIKADKSNNNAVAAITKLKNIYESISPISFMVLKVKYCILDKKIHINDIEVFSLEEVSLLFHVQDNRNWNNNPSSNNKNNGRLQISKKFFLTNKKDISQISYKSTKEEIEGINR